MRKSTRVNLNKIHPVDDFNREVVIDSSVCDESKVSAWFDQLETRLVNSIKQSDFVVGCMAWLTNRRVLEALSGLKYGCQIVVQKEDFLRPGVVGREELRRMYDSLRCLDRFQLPGRASDLSYCGDPTAQPVRCMGIAPRNPGHVVPRMHHKFFVFFKVRESIEGPHDSNSNPYTPHAVWTGSFNATENATLSRENALLIQIPKIVNGYIEEWSRVFALSEPLNWTSEFVEPEWRFGS